MAIPNKSYNIRNIDGGKRKLSYTNGRYHWQQELEVPPRRVGSMAEGNLCKCGGSGMSICTATELKKDSEKVNKQKTCKYFKKATFSSKCSYETFGEFCWCTDAQDAAKKG